jgi:CHAT domain-containing protein
MPSLTASYQDVEAQIRSESPRYAALTNPQPLTVKEVQTRVVDRDSVLLQYFLGMTRSYVWAITSERVTAYALPPRAEIERRVRPLWEALSNPAGPEAAPAGSGDRGCRDALEVGRMLLGPVAHDLDRPRVLVLPDGILQLLPFAALPAPDAPADRFVPLIVDREVVNLPSASTLALVHEQWNRKRRWSKSVVVFADPVFEADDSRFAAPGSRTSADGSPAVQAVAPALAGSLGDVPAFAGARIPRLLESRREALGIKALAPGADLRLGFDANRAAVASPKLADYRVVHFATHGVLNDRHPERSGVILSLFDGEGKPEDGYLRLNDISNLHLPADLVVLSACSTALGKEVLGGGLVGLVRGFMHAGSRRVLASLWKVDDEATSALMTEFYRGLFVRGLTAPAALRAAQVDLLTNSPWTHPFYWAAFVLQGEWN